MAVPLQEESFQSRLFSNAGTMFLLGQGLCLVSSGYHSIVHAPSGHRVTDFLSGFSLSAIQNVNQTAAWSLVSAAFDPLTNKFVEPGWKRGAVTGALTGAVLQIRSGVSGMVYGALGGALQPIGLSILQAGLVKVVRPIQRYRLDRARARFAKERAETMFATPFSVIGSAFWN
jgi:hypothetical protein